MYYWIYQADKLRAVNTENDSSYVWGGEGAGELLAGYATWGRRVIGQSPRRASLDHWGELSLVLSTMSGVASEYHCSRAYSVLHSTWRPLRGFAAAASWLIKSRASPILVLAHMWQPQDHVSRLHNN